MFSSLSKEFNSWLPQLPVSRKEDPEVSLEEKNQSEDDKRDKPLEENNEGKISYKKLDKISYDARIYVYFYNHGNFGSSTDSIF